MAAIVNKEKCTGCESCVEVCPVDAIKVEKDIAVIDEEECVECGACIEECPNDAILIPPKCQIQNAKCYQLLTSDFWTRR